jgi:hypothetical protein
MSYTREQIESAVKSKGYAWFEAGELNVNVVGVSSGRVNSVNSVRIIISVVSSVSSFEIHINGNNVIL